MVYEYTDVAGGGDGTDYFRTANRTTPPTGTQLRRCLDGAQRILRGVQAIAGLATELAGDLPFPGPPPQDACHPCIFDLVVDGAAGASALDGSGP